jgi:hypothetical protein
MLSILRRGHTYHVRYASSNPYESERQPYACPDEGAVVTMLRHCGIDAWSLQQAMATLRKGGMAVLPVVLSQVQLQVYYPALGAPHGGMDADGQADPGATVSAQGAALARATGPAHEVCQARANAAT